jgi:hypothetical protein
VGMVISLVVPGLTPPAGAAKWNALRCLGPYRVIFELATSRLDDPPGVPSCELSL